MKSITTRSETTRCAPSPFIQRWWECKDAGIRYLPNLPETDVLTTFFYESLEGVIPAGFVRDWYQFELELRNFTVALALESGHTDTQGIEIKDKLIPSGWVWEEISQGAKAGKDVGKNMDWPDRIREEQSNVRRSELVCEEVRWTWIDERIGAELNSADAIYAHLIRLGSVERWEELTRQSGETRFNSIVIPCGVPSGSPLNSMGQGTNDNRNRPRCYRQPRNRQGRRTGWPK